jgi:hypothetical protein
VGSAEWLLAVVGAVAVRANRPPPHALSVAERRERLESMLRASGLVYGTGAVDPAIELDPAAQPGERAFAHLVAGFLRLCAKAAVLSGSHHFASASPQSVAVRRNQLLAVLGAVAGHGGAAQVLFRDAASAPDAAAHRMAAKVAARLSRRFLALGGPFAGLPLHNGLCAVEVRSCATLALASFGHGRISTAAAHVGRVTALAWRATLVELLAALARAQENGRAALRGMEQVLRGQRLPVREHRQLKRALAHPRPLEELAGALHAEALRRFAIEQVLLAALVDRNFDAGELAFVERFAQALGIGSEELALLEVEVDEFYRKNREALAALRLAETPEGLPHALTTRLRDAVLDNLDRILQEIGETGELAQLLAKASAGTSLSKIEKQKVRAQLLDLAKTIPALAIFAAPGGLLLLPILLKLLPFNLLPSSFVDPPPVRSRPALPPARARKSGS